MDKNKEIPEHLFIKNPFNGKLVNILPLFELMNRDTHVTGGGAKNIVLLIQDIHDFTSSKIELESDSTFESQFYGLKTVNYGLIQLRKTFEQMEEFKN